MDRDGNRFKPLADNLPLGQVIADWAIRAVLAVLRVPGGQGRAALKGEIGGIPCFAARQAPRPGMMNSQDLRAARPLAATLRRECRRGPTAARNSPDDATRSPQGLHHLHPSNGLLSSGVRWLSSCFLVRPLRKRRLKQPWFRQRRVADADSIQCRFMDHPPNIAIIGAWSEGFAPFRSWRSISALVQQRARGAVAKIVQPQPVVLRKSKHPVIPPEVQVPFGMPLAMHVHKPPRQQIFQGGADGGMVENRFLPGGRVGNVKLVPGHVEVAADGQRRLGRGVVLWDGPHSPARTSSRRIGPEPSSLAAWPKQSC